MAKKSDSTIVSIVHPVCCGLDVHKKKISACLITVCPESGSAEYEIQEYGAFTDDLIKLKKWLMRHDCPVVAMESTGVYWHPVHNVLEGDMAIVLVNARHMKNVPGRKTDIADSKWLAELLRHGLVRASFIPDKEVRHWRELTALRKSYIKSASDYKRRVHKLFETANIKIDSVVSDLFGATGRNLMELLIRNDGPPVIEDIRQCAKGSLKSKANELHKSIQGFFEDHHRFELTILLETIAMMEKKSAMITGRLEMLMGPYSDLLDRLDEIPGVDKIAAQSILSQLGTDLKTFKNEAALASWAGLCPGNNESAGKRKSGRSSVQKHQFKELMVEIGWSAIKKRGSYYKEKYHRLKSRRGAKRAIIAIGHRISKAIFHIIKYGERYKELGSGHLIKKKKSYNLERLKKQAEKLGFSLEPAQI